LAQLVREHVLNLDDLEETVIENADNILQAIDIDEFLKDPEGYLLLLCDAFLKEHIDEIEQASEQGKKFAEKIIKSI